MSFWHASLCNLSLQKYQTQICKAGAEERKQQTGSWHEIKGRLSLTTFSERERGNLESGNELFLCVVLRMWSEQVQLVLLWLPTSSCRIVIISLLEFLACQNGYLGNYFEGESGQMHEHKVNGWLAWGFECIFKASTTTPGVKQFFFPTATQEELTSNKVVMGIVLVSN